MSKAMMDQLWPKSWWQSKNPGTVPFQIDRVIIEEDGSVTIVTDSHKAYDTYEFIEKFVPVPPPVFTAEQPCQSSPGHDLVGSPCSYCHHPGHWQVECAYCGLDERIRAMVAEEVERRLGSA